MTTQNLTSEQIINGLVAAGFSNAQPFLTLTNDLGVRIDTLLEDLGFKKSDAGKYNRGLNEYQNFVVYSKKGADVSFSYRDEKEYAARGYNEFPPVSIKIAQ